MDVKSIDGEKERKPEIMSRITNQPITSLTLSLEIISKKTGYSKDFSTQLKVLVSELLKAGYLPGEYDCDLFWNRKNIGSLKFESFEESNVGTFKNPRTEYKSKCRVLFNESAPEPWKNYMQDVILSLKIDPNNELYLVSSGRKNFLNDHHLVEFLKQCELIPAAVEKPILLPENKADKPIDCVRLCSLAYSYRLFGYEFPHGSVKNVFSYLRRAIEAGAPLSYELEAREPASYDIKPEEGDEPNNRRIMSSVCGNVIDLTQNPSLLRRTY